MVDPVARFTSLEPAAPAGRAGASAPKAETPQASPARPETAEAVELRLSPQARAFLGQIAAARGEGKAKAAPAAPPGSRVNIVI